MSRADDISKLFNKLGANPSGYREIDFVLLRQKLAAGESWPSNWSPSGIMIIKSMIWTNLMMASKERRIFSLRVITKAKMRVKKLEH